MRKVVPACVLSLALAVLLASAGSAAPDLTSYGEMMTLLASMEAVDDSVGHGRMSVVSVGRSVQGREIPMVTVAGSGVRLEDTRRMFIICRQHGDEPATTEAMLKLITDLVFSESEQDTDLLDKVSFFVVPMVNPDGAERNQRRNAKGADLNRDWLARSQPEIRAVSAAIDSVDPEVIVDAHELSPSNRGSDYLQCAGPASGAPQSVAQESLRIQSLIVGMLNTHDMQVGSYQIHDQSPARLAHRFFPIHEGTKTFLFETRQAGSRSDQLDYRMGLHLVGAMTIAKYLAGQEEQIALRIADWKRDQQRMLASRKKQPTRATRRR